MIRTNLFSAAVFLMAPVGVVGTAAGAALTLVEKGQPAAVIVTAAAPSDNAQAAAAELQHYLRRMSGAELPIITDNQPIPNDPLILVGPSRLTPEPEELNLPTGVTKNLREEGFVILVRGNRLILMGNDTEPYYGTRYAVVELLHRLGVRWFMPGEFGEVVPQQETIAVEDSLNLLQRPDFPLRNYWQHGRGNMAEEDREWKIHNKMNPRAQDWVGVPSDGSIGNYLPRDQFETHPDWFALGKGGQRQRDMACMTSEGMIQHFIERVKADARDGKRFSAFAPPDGTPRCYCENCLKRATAFDGFGSNPRDPWPESSTSNEWFYFVNRILTGVNEEFPDHLVTTNGYANRDIPPELPDFNPRQNLVIMFANISACTLHRYDDPKCWQMQRQGQMVKRFCELSDKVWIYNYNYTMLVHKGTLTPMVHRIRRNIPLLKEWGLLGFFDQDEADWAQTGIPTRIVRARLEWDTEADVEGILDDFFDKWFGAAAKPMRAYYDALEKAFDETTEHGHEDVVLNGIYTPELMAVLDRAMREAEGLARGEQEKSHVALERILYDHLRGYVALEAAKRECRFAKAAEWARRLVASQERMNRVTPFMGWHPYPVYDAAWEAERMEKLAARTDGPEGKLVAVLPESVRAQADPFDDGRYARWQDPDWDDSDWKRLRTTRGWESQGYQDAQGHPYRGLMWYRLTVDLPATVAGRSVWLYAPAVAEEAWVWVNGQYAGRRPYQAPWFRPHSLELDISPFVRPGESNQLTLRVRGNIDVWGASGIYERMFLYARQEEGRGE